MLQRGSRHVGFPASLLDLSSAGAAAAKPLNLALPAAAHRRQAASEQPPQQPGARHSRQQAADAAAGALAAGGGDAAAANCGCNGMPTQNLPGPLDLRGCVDQEW